ncbi:MAG: hypothetical protein JSV27_11400 [Candidatus Bathyarchaeota archaeon]|nr:MAG: hypothetical protein JSV27_11400 [Candidatus Bathyarchaeota archaeon]
MRPEESTAPDNSLLHNGILVNLDDDLSRYLTFLEKNRLVKRREDVVLASLRIYKKLNMHDWLPHVYRSGGERVLLMGQGMLHDIFTSMSGAKLYEVARMTALKRRMIDPIDEDLDLSEPSNWGVVLNELENMGWGRFTHEGGEVMVEFLGVPIDFMRGYLETLFLVEFSVHRAMDGEVYVLKSTGRKAEVWR